MSAAPDSTNPQPSAPRPTFLGLPDAGERARIAVVCAPYDLTSTYGKGADRGPQALLAASYAVETWDEETGRDLEPLGYTVWRPSDEAAFGRQSPEAMVAELEAVHERHLAAGRITLGLGGEHGITYGQFAALHRRHPDLAVLQLDAHLDLRDSYEGSKHNHACIAARFLEAGVPLVQVGMRSCSREESALVAERGLRVHWAREVAGHTAYHREVLAALVERPVFVTLDLDGFDPSIMPATGTPEPGGLSWFDVTRLLSTVARHCTVVGADITELAPADDDAAAGRIGGPVAVSGSGTPAAAAARAESREGSRWSRPSEFLAARLAAKMVAYFWVR
ncbi:MAG TPA: agmatinase [Planctomycetota bacterium]|nr:agmatinase [Planctomycetota bacterium]